MKRSPKPYLEPALLFVVLTAPCGCSSSSGSGGGAGASTGGTVASMGGVNGAVTGGASNPTPNGGGGSSGTLPSSNGGTTAAGAGGVSATAGATGGIAGSTVAAGGSGNAFGTGGATSSNGGATTGGAGSSGGSAGEGDGGSMRPYKGVANSPCAARTALNVSWYYNWEQKEDEPCSDGRGGEFVPMIWGHTGAEQTASSIHSAVQSMATQGYANVLGFNEPDNTSQSNISVATAIGLWPAFAVPGIRVGSPATSANTNGQSWFKDFMNRLGSDPSLRADFVAIHWYGWNSGSCDSKASQLESYVEFAEGVAGNRPIWITEWGCLNQSAPDTATVVAFYKAAVAMFGKHPSIARYAWYPWSTNCELNDENGALTELGTAYAAAPAFK